MKVSLWPQKQDANENERLCVYLIEKALSKCSPGTEDILGIFDLRGFSTDNSDFFFLKFLVISTVLCSSVFAFFYRLRLVFTVFLPVNLYLITIHSSPKLILNFCIGFIIVLTYLDWLILLFLDALHGCFGFSLLVLT